MRLSFAVQATLLGFGLSVASQVWAECRLLKLAEMPVTMSGMRPTIQAKFNGSDVRLIVDSGAFFSTLSSAAASEFNLPLKSAHGLEVSGVGGKAKAQIATVKTLRIFDIDIPNVEFVVGGSDVGGDVVGLLGQNLLRVGDVEYDLAHGVIRIIRPEGCRNDTVAYWASSQPLSIVDIAYATASTPHTVGTAKLNGTSIAVAFDTGAAFSVVSKAAAAMAGIKLDAPGVVASDPVSGVGSHFEKSWIAPVNSFKIGDEEIRNTRVRIADIGMQRFDMLLGADFFLSHRIYVASSQRKLYFTYNGGPVFNLDRKTPATAASAGSEAPSKAASTPESSITSTDTSTTPATTAGSAANEAPAALDKGEPAASGTAAVESPPPATANPGDPTNAAEFSRRGTAFAARRDFEHAIRDLTRAIELDPQEASYRYERGTARLQNGEADLALEDFNQSLTLRPDDLSALVSRAGLRLARKDTAGATADLDTAARVAPKESETRLVLGNLYMQARLYDPAAAQFDLWLAAHHVDSALPLGLSGRCWARALAGDELNRAVEDCDAALKVVPKDPRLISARALVQYKLGNLDKAISGWSDVVAKDPKNAWALYARGVARLRKGMRTEGQADITAATGLSSTIADFSRKRGVVPPE